MRVVKASIIYKYIKMKAQKNTSGWGIGAVIGVIGGLIGGGYYLYGTKDGKKTRKHMTGWALKMKGEVLERAEKLKDVNKEAYADIIESVQNKYKKLKNIDPTDVSAIAQELLGHWKKIEKEVVATAKKTGKKLMK
jgi:uncharacterized protein YfkK (UPF0435 family)